jgi:hypothetical protein
MNENTEIDEEQCLSDWKSHNLSCDESIRIHDYCERAFRHAWKLKQGEVDLYKNKLKNTNEYNNRLNNVAQDLLLEISKQLIEFSHIGKIEYIRKEIKRALEELENEYDYEQQFYDSTKKIGW